MTAEQEGPYKAREGGDGLFEVIGPTHGPNCRTFEDKADALHAAEIANEAFASREPEIEELKKATVSYGKSRIASMEAELEKVRLDLASNQRLCELLSEANKKVRQFAEEMDALTYAVLDCFPVAFNKKWLTERRAEYAQLHEALKEKP